MPKANDGSESLDYSHAAITGTPFALQMLSEVQRAALAWHVLRRKGRAVGDLRNFAIGQGVHPNSVGHYVYSKGKLKPNGEQLLSWVNATATGIKRSSSVSIEAGLSTDIPTPAPFQQLPAWERLRRIAQESADIPTIFVAGSTSASDPAIPSTLAPPVAEPLQLPPVEQAVLDWSSFPEPVRAGRQMRDFAEERNVHLSGIIDYIFMDGTLTVEGRNLLSRVNDLRTDAAHLLPAPGSTAIQRQESGSADAAAAYLLTDPRHRDHGLFLQASVRLGELPDVDWTQERRVRLAAAVVVSAKKAGLERLDALDFNRHAPGLLTAGQRRAFGTETAHTEIWRALVTPLEQSSAECLLEAQRNQRGTSAPGQHEMPQATQPGPLSARRRR